MGPLLVPLLAAGASLFNNVAEGITASRERKFADRAWDKQNTYNSPAAQLQRYKEAGMNPAYGAGMASGNAAQMSPSASVAGHVQLPEVLSMMGQYQSNKNAELEGQRLEQLITGQKIDNMVKDLNRQYLDKTLNPRVGQQVHKESAMLYDSGNKGITYDNRNSLYADGKNPELAKYNLDVQRFDQSKQMFEIDKALADLNLSDTRSGLNNSDSTFLRVLRRKWQGEESASKLLPYVIGEGVVNFGGKLLQNAIPKLPFQRYKFDWNGNTPKSSIYRSMPRGN